MKHVWSNRKQIARLNTGVVGSIYAIVGFAGMFVPLDELLPETLSLTKRIACSFGILLGIWLVSVFALSWYLSRKKRFDVITANGGHKLYVQYGDLFDENEVLNPSERRNIIVPVNRCFDTIVDNQLISEKTLHGIAFKKLYASGRYTEESLNTKIQELLASKNYEYEMVPETLKPAGNTKRYLEGTIVDLPGCGNEHLLLWALSTFDCDLKARTSMQQYVLAVQKLIEACSTESEGFPVVLPLVGTGLSRVEKNQIDVLSYLLSAFKLNRDKINCDIHIIVHDDAKHEIAIMDVKREK